MYDCTVSGMSILCLWDIQLTFDWVRMETRGTYPRKSKLKSTVRVYRNFNIFAEVIVVYETALF